MNQNEATNSLKRILALLSMNLKQEAAYIHSIRESCSWMPAIRFEEVCKTLVAEMGQRKPVPAQYKAIYDRLAQTKGWNIQAAENKCDNCHQTGWVMQKFRTRDTQDTISAARPCPSCRLIQYDTWPIKPELELVETS